MATTLDQVIEEAFADDDLHRVAEAVGVGRADDGLQRLYEAWPEWASGWQPPPLPEGQLRPFAYNNWKGHDGGGLASAWMDLVGRPEGSEELQGQVVRHLLFCDSVAVPDPMFRTADGHRFVPRVSEMISDRPAQRAWAAAAIDSVHRYRELIAANIIVIVPAPTIVNRLVPAATSAVTDPSTTELFPPLPPDWWGFSHHHIAAIDTAVQLASSGGELDPYLPTQGHLSVFRQLARSADRTMREAFGISAPNAYNAILPHLLSCPLPDPGRLSLHDLAVIRKDGHFQAWRDAVAAGARRCIDLIGEDPESWPNAGEVLRGAISQEVEDAAEAAKASIGWTRNRSIDVSVDLALVGGTAAAAFLAPPVAAGLAGLEGAKLLAGVFRRWRFARGSFARHVAVFSAPTRR
jgi:hypothetical protein